MSSKPDWTISKSKKITRWWMSSRLTGCHKLVCSRNKTDRNARSGSKNFNQYHSTVSSGGRFQKV